MILEQDVHQALVPHERRVGCERRSGDVRERRVVRRKRPVGGQGDLRRDDPRSPEAGAAFVERDAVRDP